ncbi:glycosyltransferase family 25 protein [uncultured Parabacteroides sp.]|uniref:glycosyltransferase family 25 protein n=1 Tax=uncultured Parabacteroides sp. TaxID=512312 RepID=UPI002587105E|nr:glycosyltransferase family 25 protein [uncultured Parabacteroides sp.]
MDRLKTYVINLPKDLDRRGSILKETGQFPCLDIEMIEAVYGKELSDKEKNNLFDCKKYTRYYGRALLPGEIGCVLSHQMCYKHLLETDLNYALILEDDAHFVDSEITEQFMKSVHDLMNSSIPRILLLHASFEYTGEKKIFCEKYSVCNIYNALFATGYLINKNAARLLLPKGSIYWVADDWFLFRSWGVDIYSLYPSVVVQQRDKLKSSIMEEQRKSKKRIFPHSRIECRLAYNRINYLIKKRIGIIKSMHL